MLRYRFISATLLVAAVAGILLLTPWAGVAQWVASGYAILIAVRSGWSMVTSLRTGTWGIDILAVAAIVSTVAIGDYWASLVVVLMLMSGEALEDFAAHRARSELTALMSRAPRIAHRESGDAVDDVPVDVVVAGDVLEVKPGEAVPVDSTLLSDGAYVDQSSINGESLPVWTGAGAQLLSGAINTDDVIRIRATTTAQLSQYQTIVDLVRGAADSRAPFVRLADRVAIPFTIGAFTLGIVAWIISGDPVRLAEVLVVATPCPLLIATPVAFIAGMSRAAARGVIVKGGGALEQLSRVRTAAFDKTGTITQGIPRVDRIDSLGGDDAQVLALAAALETHSAHVLAQAIVDGADGRSLDLPAATEVTEVVAMGLRGLVDGTEVAVGKLAFVALDAPQPWGALAAGETAVYVSRDNALVGRVVLTDQVRPEAAEAMARLHHLGVVRTLMLSGDAQDTAGKVAKGVGIDDVRGGLMPIDKVEAMRSIQPRPAMMVGDGVNDAPVLAVADVGVAMGARGATAASESADVVVLIDDLGRVPEVVSIAQRTVRIAYQSIGFGISLSVVLMLVASVGVLPAIIGAALQEVVDVVTILNSLRAGRHQAVGSRDGTFAPASRVSPGG
ncbi:heavy metal-(Cd/Co/Hg/Pb/Zn)-translocating P-type ATPase [Salinibacterium xinjiangense]|uniref:Heavy metal-(Cd/Co/Hg/Pb/Zn)-translocating P-type ATPase n=1 Tax=Salinibacterium xinjiangense TaxID=386302 RepID=A0A2C8YDH2_9MICO|nr:heavy metal translocating P-type ATPase [Salinibacterium xinjiangense]SOE48365.1 heavy metal-(Cd/Co/Hg/Pb/Zn)-translocating P-type ATPase [Salinibacterium xinjiangense]